MPDASMPAAKPANKKPLIILATIVVLLVVLVSVLVLALANRQPAANSNPNPATNPQSSSTAVTEDQRNTNGLIKHIGITLDYYDEETMRAGDIVFSESQFGEYDMPYFDFGFQVLASSAAPARRNPQPTFIVPLGTKVHSLIDGEVVGVHTLYSGDYSIHVSPGGGSEHIFETEHVINPLVQEGDRVTAGQVIAEVSDYDAHNYAGFGLYEIGILIGGNPPSHVCPFEYLDESIKEDTYAKLRDLYKAWNKFRGKQVYDENLTIPGCITTEPVEG